MIRRIFMLVSVVSLLLCAAAAWCWARGTFPHGESRLFLERPDGLCMIRLENSRIVFGRPPDAPGVLAAQKSFISQRFNERLQQKHLVASTYAYEKQKALVIWVNFRSPPNLTWVDTDQPEVMAALIPFLADPDRFALAHLLLSRRGCFCFETNGSEEAGRFIARVDGMTFDCGSRAEWEAAERADTDLVTARTDPAQIPAIRQLWADRLNVPAWSVPLWAICAATAVLPAAWMAQRGRAWRRKTHRRRTGLCLACGFDLRATQERCPECGVVVQVA